MSIEGSVFRNASWLALFKLFSQAVSWASTILVARVLVPGDYGLMELATIITGYAAIFNQLGLGSAIIQRQTYTNNELSSTFWFGFGFSILLAIACLFLAYPTSAIFHDARIIPLTQSVSVLFILSGLQIIPSSLMQKKLQFKNIGIIELVSIIVSSIAMVILAYAHAGVWTLVLGHIIRSTTRLFVTFYMCPFVPKFHFNFKEAKSFLSFGISVALAQSLFYLYNKSDKFFAGKIWTSNALGWYTFAIELAQIPTEKIVVLINQVSYPAFAKIQDNKAEFNRLYLVIMKVTATIVLPLFVGIFLLAEKGIHLILTKQWYPMIFLFQWLCIAQIPTALNAVNSFVHTAQGRPNWSLIYNAILALCMPIAFYFCSTPNINMILIPWFTVYIGITLVWIFLTLKKLSISLSEYIGSIQHAIIATVLMSLVVISFQKISGSYTNNLLATCVTESVLGAIAYISYFWIFDRSIFLHILKLKSVK